MVLVRKLVGEACNYTIGLEASKLFGARLHSVLGFAKLLVHPEVQGMLMKIVGVHILLQFKV